MGNVLENLALHVLGDGFLGKTGSHDSLSESISPQAESTCGPVVSMTHECALGNVHGFERVQFVKIGHESVSGKAVNAGDPLTFTYYETRPELSQHIHTKQDHTWS